MADMEKLLPQNAEAEMGALGSILISPEALAKAATLVSPEDFYREAHRTIYDAALTLHHAHEPVDLITLTDELARRGKLDEVGGISYVSSLANQVPTSRNVERYARIVRELANLRRLIDVAGSIAAIAYNEPAWEDAYSESMQLLLGLAKGHETAEDFAPIDVALHEAMEEILERMEGARPAGIATGLPELDAAIGGMEPTDLVIIAGRPGSLKSQMGAHLAVQETLRRVEAGEGTVAWVTLEMTRAQQARRLLSNAARVNSRKLRAGFVRPDGSIDRAAYAQTRGAYEALLRSLDGRLRVKDGVASLASLTRLMLREVLEHNTKLLVIDQFDLLGIDEHGPRYTKELDRLNAYSRGLKIMATQLRIPIVLLVQLNRDAVKQGRIDLTNLAGSDRLGRDANTVLALRRPAAGDTERARTDSLFREFLECNVLKARDAEANVFVPLRAEPQYSSIEPWPYAEIPNDDTRTGTQWQPEQGTWVEADPAGADGGALVPFQVPWHGEEGF